MSPCQRISAPIRVAVLLTLALRVEAAPGISHGPMIGEVSETSAVVWARAKGRGTLRFELTERAGGDRREFEVDVESETDYTGRWLVAGLEPSTAYGVAVRHRSEGEASEQVSGAFATAREDEVGSVRFVFGSCLGGQGFCRDPETGWDIFDRMLERDPAFFLMLGDGIYADDACPSANGRNVPGAETRAEDLEGFRARYRYHLEDARYRAFLARTPVYATWDDHEIRNNFGGPELEAMNPRLLAAGRQAFLEYWPLLPGERQPIYRRVKRGRHLEIFILDTRSYRDRNVDWDTDPVTGEPKSLLGKAQTDWLRAALRSSRATWKIIASSVPLSYPTGGSLAEVEGRDGWADGGDPSGYETELMALFMFIARHQIDNVVVATGDTHFAFAIQYDPDRDGEPDLYELGAGPLCAGLGAIEEPDRTFTPTVLFARNDDHNFGEIEVDGGGSLTFRSIDRDAIERYTIHLEPR